VHERDPLDVLIVASWFPSVDDGTAGRFVADQAEALLARDDVRPHVASFDTARLTGGATARDMQAAAVQSNARRAIAATDPVFISGAVGVDPRLPVARLPIPEGLTRTAGAPHQARHRGDALVALAERLVEVGPVPDLVHAHTGYPDGAGAVRLADRVGCPLVITEHASFVERILNAPDLAAEYRAAVARASRVLAVSEMLARELRSAFPEFSERIVVLPNAVAVDGFTAAPLSERRPDELLFVGYRKASKGIETLLRGFALVHAARPTATLRLIGGSPDEAAEREWQALAGTLGIGDAVRFDPPANRAEVAAAMTEASLFVHASPRETFGMVAAEALASGLPVVGTDSGGVTEVLGPEPDALGAIVERDSPEALASGILATLERRAAFDPTALRASVQRRFGASQVAERLARIYQEAIDGSSNDGSSNDGSSNGRGRATASSGRGARGGASERTRTGVSVVPVTRTSGRAVLVALDRDAAAARLARWPASARERLTLITASDASGTGRADLGGRGALTGDLREVPVTTLDPTTRRASRGGFVGRLERLARDPFGTVARRLGRGPGSRSAVSPATRAVEEALRGETSPIVVAVDGSDHLAIEAMVAAGRVVPHPGLRRLADEWLSETAGGAPSA
jgi:glycogen(starch) synthase